MVTQYTPQPKPCYKRRQIFFANLHFSPKSNAPTKTKDGRQRAQVSGAKALTVCSRSSCHCPVNGGPSAASRHVPSTCFPGAPSPQESARRGPPTLVSRGSAPSTLAQVPPFSPQLLVYVWVPAARPGSPPARVQGRPWQRPRAHAEQGGVRRPGECDSGAAGGRRVWVTGKRHLDKLEAPGSRTSSALGPWGG